MKKLNVKSSYSLLSSTLKIRDIIKNSLEQKLSYAILSDTNVLFGIPEFVSECKKNNLKAIIGMEFSFQINKEAFSVVCYAKNDFGYMNLIKISSLINNNENLIVEFDTIKTHLNNLIIVLLEKDFILNQIISNDYSKLEKTVDFFSSISKYKNIVYFGIENNDMPLFKMKNKEFEAFLKTKKNIENVVPVETVNYYDEKHESAYKILYAMLKGIDFNSNQLEYNKNSYFDYKISYTDESVYEKRIENIIENCNVKMNMKKNKIPAYTNKHNISSDIYLKKLCLAGLKKRVKNISDQYMTRLSYELEVVTKMNFSDYFLIVFDLICFAKKSNIYVGPGRGSVVGSLMAYVLGITNIDPLKYDLVFERFLNPERISLPDIDLDFEDERRDEVIAYAMKTYGYDKTSKILTFDTFGAKRTLLDVGKVLKISQTDITYLNKLIPNKPKIKLSDVYKEIPEFSKKINSSKVLTRYYELCLLIEGLPKNLSVHAAGVIISDTPIVQNCPTMKLNGVTVTQYQAEYLEALGLIKMDCLSLTNLTVIHKILNRIELKNPNFDLNNIDLNDSAVLNLFRQGSLSGIFQMESYGMRKLISNMKINHFDDLIAAISLYRPGPMNNIPLYLENRKKGKDNISYPHNSLKPILENTYGVMIYQEQIMMVARVMANFSLAKADLLRKCIAKKNVDGMQKLGVEFKESAKKNGYDITTINNVFNLIEKFAEYGFNKSHSVAYALIAYQLAYLKVYYPIEFFCEILNSSIGNSEKTKNLIENAKLHNVTIVKPDINYSTNVYEIVLIQNKTVIRMPIQVIKNIGSSFVEKIMQDRLKNGIYKNSKDLLQRFKVMSINKKTILTILDSGLLKFKNADNEKEMRNEIEKAFQ